MRKTLAIVGLLMAVVTAPAEEAAPTPAPVIIELPAPITVTETVVTESQVTAAPTDMIIIDFKSREAGVKFAGRESRIVIKGAIFDAVMAANQETLVMAFTQAVAAQMAADAAAATPSPTPEP